MRRYRKFRGFRFFDHKPLTSKTSRTRRKTIFEPLEPRLLLSADLFFAGAAALDLTLQLDYADSSVLQLIDNTDSSVLIEQALSETSGVTIMGSADSDRLVVDLDAPLLLANGIDFIDATSGDGDTLVGPNFDSTWNIDGQDSGDVEGIEFSGIENLSGAAGNEDTFVFAPGGGLSGQLEGGDGGFDSISLEGSYQQVEFLPSGPDSGAIVFDGQTITYSGFEPVDLSSGTVQDAVMTINQTPYTLFNSGEDIRIYESSPGTLTVESTTGEFEDHSFDLSTLETLTINLGIGDDTIIIDNIGSHADAPAISIFDGGGKDTLIRRDDVTLANVSLGVDASNNEVEQESATFSYVQSFLQNSGVIFSGATIVTHGYQLTDDNGDSLAPIAEAIHALPNQSWYLDYDIAGDEQPGLFDLTQSELPGAGDSSTSGELILLFDWAAESNRSSGGWTEAAGDALFSMLVGLGVVDVSSANSDHSDDIPLHFIAHSFGSAVTSEAIERLAYYDIPVDHVTFLDPHDFDQDGVPVDQNQAQYSLNLPDGYGVSIWDNVEFADVYYQTALTPTEFSPFHYLLYPAGRPIPGAHNVLLDGDNLYKPPEDDGLGTLLENYHSWVWTDFYKATILGSVATVNDSTNGIDLTSGYAYSRLAQSVNTDFSGSSDLPQTATRPAMDNFATGQDHEHTPDAIWDNGQLNAAGIAALGLFNSAGDPVTAANLATVSWSPEWSPEIVNGTFEDIYISYLDPLDWWEFSEIQPGWSHHGAGDTLTGGGEGDVAADWFVVNSYLELNSGDTDRTHNRFYVPEGTTDLYFDIYVTDAGSAAYDGTLMVFLDDLNGSSSDPNIIAEIDLGTIVNDTTGTCSDPAGGFTRYHVEDIDLPGNFAGEIHTLTFELFDISGEANVRIDDVSFSSTSANDDAPLRTYSLDGLRQALGEARQYLENLQTQYPVIVNFEVPWIDASINDALQPTIDLLNDIDTVLSQLSGDYTLADICAPIQQLLNTSSSSQSQALSYTLAGDQLRFDIDLDMLTSTQKTLSFGQNFGNGIALDFNALVDLETSLDFDFSFGLDFSNVDLAALADGDDPFDNFDYFVELNSPLEFSLDFHPTDLAAEVTLGFLGAGIEGGTVDFDLDTVIDFNGAAADTPIRLTNGDFSLLSAAEFSATSALAASLPVIVSADFAPVTGEETSVQCAVIELAPVDLLNGDSLDVQFNPSASCSLDLIDNFTNMNAASFVSMLSQLSNWLENMRTSGAFDIDLPLADAAIEEVLGFAEMISSKLLYDKGADHAFDQADTLLVDLNSALDEAGLRDRILAIADGTSITLVAIDPDISGFSLAANGSNDGGFAQLGLSGLSASGTICYHLDMTPSSAELSGDAGFDISMTIDGQSLVVPVLLSASATTGNQRIGDDTAKLVRADSSATFRTIQELEYRLTCILLDQNTTLASNLLSYDKNNFVLELNLGSLLNYTYAEEFPLDFAFELGPLLDIESDSTVAVEATVGFDENFTIGLFLGDQVPGANGTLSFGTALSTLNDGDGVNIKTDLAITAPTTPVVYGRLSGDATFDLTINNGTTYQVTVEEGVANGTDYLSFSGDSSVVNDRITFATNHGPSNGDQVVYSSGGDVGVGGLRDGKSYYVVNKTSTSLQLSATEGGTALSLTDGGSDSNHRLTFASGAANKTMSDLAADINAALAEAGVGHLVEAGYSDELHRIALVAKSTGVHNISVSVDSNDPASRDIGLTSGSVSQDESELVTYWAQKAVTALYGRLDADLNLQFYIGQPVDIHVDQQVTATNRYVFDLAKDINDAIIAYANANQASEIYDANATNNPDTPRDERILLRAEAAGNQIVFTYSGTQSASINAEPPGKIVLGFINPTDFNTYDLAIYPSGSSSPQYISLDGVTDLAGVKSAIEAIAGVTVELNAGATGLDIHGVSKIMPVNGSSAGLDLGIVGLDSTDPNDADGIINGSQLAGVKLSDRFFVTNADVHAGVKVSTPFTNLTLSFDGAGETVNDLKAINGGEDIDFVSGDDLEIQLSDGSKFKVDLSGSVTTSDIRTKIQDASKDGNGAIRVVVSLAAGSGFVLTDTTFNSSDPSANPEEFVIKPHNCSRAGVQLGLVGSDAGLISTAGADGKIEGANLGLSATAKFGIVDVGLYGGGYLGASVDTGLNDPNTSPGTSGFISLTELIGAFNSTAGISGILKPLDFDAEAILDLNACVSEPFADLLGSLPNISFALDFDLGSSSGSDWDFGDFSFPDISFPDITVPNFEWPDVDFKFGSGGDSDWGFDWGFGTSFDFGDLFDFSNLDFSFRSILDGLELVFGFLNGLEGFDFLDFKLPVLDLSFNDLFASLDDFRLFIDGLGDGGSLQWLNLKIRDLLGLDLDSDLFNISFGDFGLTDGDSNPLGMLRFDLQLGSGFEEFYRTSLDLGALLPGLDDLVGGAANLRASGDVDLTLSFGIDLDNPGDVYIFPDKTGVRGSLSASADDLTFVAGVGPIDLSIKEGRIQILNGLDLDGEAGNDSLFQIRLKDESTPLKLTSTLLGDLGLDLFNIDVKGDFELDLPVYFPTQNSYRGDIAAVAGIEWFDNAPFQGSTNEFVVGDITWHEATDNLGYYYDLISPTPETLEAMFNVDLRQLSLIDKILFAVDGLDFFLGELEGLLAVDLFDVDLPLLGNLGDAGNFITDFRVGFLPEFRLQIENLANPDMNIVTDLLYAAFGPSGLGILLDVTDSDGDLSAVRDCDGTYHFSDSAGADGKDEIILRTNIDNPDIPVEELFMEWEMILGDNLDIGQNLSFDLGYDAFGLEVNNAELNVDLDWQLDFGFGLSWTDGFYLLIDDTDELLVDIHADLGGSQSNPAELIGRFGILQLTARDGLNRVDDPATTDDDDVREKTHFDAQFSIDLGNGQPGQENDERLSFSEIGSLEITPELWADAAVYLEMELGINGAGTGFPKITGDFVLDWGVGSATGVDANFNGLIDFCEMGNVTPEASLSAIGDALVDGLEYVALENFNLDLGSFLAEVIGPMLSEVQNVTEPMQPLIDIMTTPLPVISDLGPDLTLLDLAAAYGEFDPGLIYALADLIEFVNSIPDPQDVGALLLPLGDFVIYQSSDAAEDIDDIWNKAKNNYETLKNDFENNFNLDTALAGINGGDAATKESMQTLTGGGGGAFAFPILDNPSQVFGLLMGNDVTLVTYDLAPFFMKFEWSQFFPIYGPLGVSVNVEFSVDIDLAFGFDTYGIRQFIDADFSNPLLIMNGLYVSDDPDLSDNDGIPTTDDPELIFGGGLWAAAELNLGVARAGVGGGIFAEVEFDLYDPNNDLKIRLGELATNFMNEWNYGTPALAPLAIFDVSGIITAELFAFLKVDLWLLEIDETFNITPPITLAEFDIDFARPPVLATELDNGDLQLNMGAFAEQRINPADGEGDKPFDGAEKFYVATTGNNQVAVWAPELGIPADKPQLYTVTGNILAGGGDYDDIIDLSGVTQANIGFILDGGAGSDKIYAGAGNAVIRGGSGNDTLEGGSGNDVIYGEDGADTIKGGGGHDTLFGNTGSILGGSITVSASSGDDPDTIYGDAGNDFILAGGNNDRLEGGAGNDILLGDGGTIRFVNDTVAKTVANVSKVDYSDDADLSIGYGEDTLFGNAGNDRIYGGPGNDIIDGGAGDDIIRSESSTSGNTVYGGSGNDQIWGSDKGDTLYGFRDTGDANADQADTATDGNDIIYADAGDDVVYGGAGSDQIWGERGNDVLFGGDDADIISGGLDNDLIAGGLGKDELDGGSGDDYVFGWYVYDLTAAGYQTVVPGSLAPSSIVLPAQFSQYIEATPDTSSLQPEADDDTIYVKQAGGDFLDGQHGNDKYIVNLTTPVLEWHTIEVMDTGTVYSAADMLTLRGTDEDDTFLARASYLDEGLAFVALVKRPADDGISVDTNTYYNRANYYKSLESITVDGLMGDDRFFIDDTKARMTISGGAGNDSFQVGQLFKSARNADAQVAELDVFATLPTTRGYLSNGASEALTINGGLGNDSFSVFHTMADLSLYGQDGDDTFVVKAFALAGASDEGDVPRMFVDSGGGADFIQYAINAPIFIDGGDGFDTLVVTTTEFRDDIVVTEDGIYGGGLNVNFVNIESSTVDAAEGDDRIFILGTEEGVLTSVAGGLGSDTFNVSGPTPPVVANDLLGHSGIISHSVDSADASYDGLKVEGISANVADDDEPGIVITPSSDIMDLIEGQQLSYTIVLTKQPTADVQVTIFPPELPAEDRAKGYKTIKFVGDGAPTVPGDPLVLTFTDSNWDEVQTVTFEAIKDYVIEGTFEGKISHKIQSLDFIEADMEAWTDTALTATGAFEGVDTLVGLTVTLVGPDGVMQNRVIASNTADTLTLRGDDGWLFTPDAGSKIQVSRYDGLTAPGLSFKISDADEASVVVTQSGDSTDLIEGGIGDSYELSLTRKPTEDVTVYITANDGQFTVVDSVTFIADSVTVDSETGEEVWSFGNWNTSQTISLTALDDGTKEGFHNDYAFHMVTSLDTGTVESTYDAFAASEEDRTSVLLKHDPLVTEISSGTAEGSGIVDDVPDGTMGVLNEANIVASGPNVLLYDAEADFGSNNSLAGKILYINDGPGRGQVRLITGNTSDTLVVDRPWATALVAESSTYQIFDYSHISLVTELADEVAAGSDLNGDGVLGTASLVVELGHYLALGNTIMFVDDDGKPLPRNGSITVEYDYQVSGYHDADTDRVLVNLADNEAPGVIITESNGSTNVIETPDNDGVPWTDTYDVVLSKRPDQDVYVTITPEETLTSNVEPPSYAQVTVSSSAPDSVDNGDGTITLKFTKDNWNTAQTVKVAAIDDTRVDGGDVKVFADTLYTVNGIQGPLLMTGAGGEGSLSGLGAPYMLQGETNIKASLGTISDVDTVNNTVTVSYDEIFGLDAETRNDFQLDDVNSVEDLVDRTFDITTGPGSEVEYYNETLGKNENRPQFRLITAALDNGDGTITLTLNEAWSVKPGETPVADDSTYAITKESLNFFVDETQQVDFLNVLNTDSVADTVGYLTDSTLDPSKYDSHLSGLGMGLDTNIGGKEFPGGITFGGMEVSTIYLGEGNDTFTVDAAQRREGFQTWTILHTGEGDDTVYVVLQDDGDELFEEGEDGNFMVDTGLGDDHVYAHDSTLGITIFGGLGEDELVGGSGADTIFGDLGQVDYVNQGAGEVVTRLGTDPIAAWLLTEGEASVEHASGLETYVGLAGGSISGWVDASAVNTTTTQLMLTGSEFAGMDLSGLRVYLVNGIDTPQSRLIESNTDNILNIDEDWDLTGLGAKVLVYIGGLPQNQTDGVLRDAELLLSVNGDTGGVDTITGNAGDDAIIGGAGGDIIHGNAGNNVIFGDNARLFAAPVDAAAMDAGAPLYWSDLSTQLPDVGGNDVIDAAGDNDIVFGGAGADTVTISGGHNIVLGDNGMINYGSDGDLGDIDLIDSTDPAVGGVDMVTTGSGDDMIVGGAYGDIIDSGDGYNLVIGDNGSVTATDGSYQTLPNQPMTIGRIETTAFGIGGVDVITTGTGSDIVLGGHDEGTTTVGGTTYSGDTINVGSGHNIVLGDDGTIVYDDDSDPSDIDEIVSTSTTAAGGADSITSLGGQDIIIGGRFGDTINAGDGDNLVIGDSGRIRAGTQDEPQLSGQPMTFGLIATIQPDDGGVDQITTESGEDTILGGFDGDTITAGAGDDLILGDNGLVNYGADATYLDRVESKNRDLGGSDTISGDAGSDTIIGGIGGDTIYGDNSTAAAGAADGEDILIGDNAEIIYAADSYQESDQGRLYSLGDSTVSSISTTDTEEATGGDDDITGNAAGDLIVGGVGGDTIYGDAPTQGGYDGDDLILGDNGTVDFGADPDYLDKVTTSQYSTAAGAAILGGHDEITGDYGSDTIIGGVGGDTIYGDNSTAAAGAADG
ncbi:MAG: calcium-binding protein, partial [Desulfuromonadales bacterium]|nr:calcium-binding protein [Desulfuromonadales bacterium]